MKVEPINWPERLSQTLLRTHDKCPYSAYLMAKYDDRINDDIRGPRSHEMDRGTLYHACAERLMADLIQHGETTLFDPGAGDEEQLSQMTAAIVDEVRREHPELVVPHAEADVVRLSLFHTALGLDVLPDNVLAIEQKFVLELACGWTVSVKADLISMPEPGVAQVDDYKTSLYIPAENDWDPFQTKVGALALLQGRPMAGFACPVCDGEGMVDVGADHIVRRCSRCDGRGKFEVVGVPLAVGIHSVRGRELYPRRGLRQDGHLHRNSQQWTALELAEFRQDLEAMGEQVTRELAGWEFEARPGSHCNICAAIWDCPLRPQERDLQGIPNAEMAAAILGEAQRENAVAKKLEKAARDWAKEHDEPLVVGGERFEWKTTEHRELLKSKGRTDWETVRQAVERGGMSLDDVSKIARRTTLSKRKDSDG